MEKAITLTVNGQKKTVTTNPQRPLLEVLREDLRLTGTKYGCGEGQCGACTVLLGGKAVFSCITPVADAEGQTVLTIEGAAGDEMLQRLQEAFLAESALQCGYCTPGMILGAEDLLRGKPNPTAAEIRSGMSKHVCRCGSYPRIEKAIRRAAHAGK
jgi:aerobic-type carbon monoxide dehydrogenase small subunit (CoxS/CutS family)